MAKQGGKVLNFVAWLTGVIVALAVGFGMTGETLTIPWIAPLITVIAGWVVVVTTIISVVLVVLKQ